MIKYAGVLGGGNISETHARAALETKQVEIAAIHGTNVQKTARLAGLYGGAVYEDFDRFMEHRPMDLVMIGTPSGLHTEQGIVAALSGLHVLVEKPMAITTEQADDLIAACDRSGVKLGVFFQDRAKAHLRKAKELIDSNRLGKPILASASVRWFRPPDYYSQSRWRGTRALDGGGALMNQGIHTVDLLLWLLGDVSRVYASAITALHTIDVEDTVVATLEFRSGAIATLEATTAAYPGYNRRVQLSGSEGTILIEQDRIVAADLRKPADDIANIEPDANPSAHSALVSDVRGHQAILEDFLGAIEVNGTACCDGREGRRSVELVQAIYESSRTRCPVVPGKA